METHRYRLEVAQDPWCGNTQIPPRGCTVISTVVMAARKGKQEEKKKKEKNVDSEAVTLLGGFGQVT